LRAGEGVVTFMKSQGYLQLLIAPLLLLNSGMYQVTKVLKSPVGQPAGERAAQQHLPQSQNPIWFKFAKCKVGYDNRTGLFNIAITPEVRALEGKSVTVTGFVLPLDGSDETKHFLLARNTPVCLFCPPGAPNEMIEVVSPQPVDWTDKMVTVTGPLGLEHNGEKGMFFRIVPGTVR